MDDFYLQIRTKIASRRVNVIIEIPNGLNHEGVVQGDF